MSRTCSANGIRRPVWMPVVMLKCCACPIRPSRRKDRDIVVISGALSPTGGWVEPDGTVTAIDDFAFFQQLLEQGMLDYADCVGAHHNGYNIGPDVTAEDAPNDPGLRRPPFVARLTTCITAGALRARCGVIMR
jgi:hypothetical protein